jgi:hypothetical protein
MSKKQQLEQQLSELTIKKQEAQLEIENQSRIKASYEKREDAILKQLAKLSSVNDLVVSDHAIVRYLERVLKYDVEVLKKQILTDELKSYAKNFKGNGKFPFGEKHEFQAVIKNNIVVTFLSHK